MVLVALYQFDTNKVEDLGESCEGNHYICPPPSASIHVCLHYCNSPTTMDEALLLFSVVVVIIAVLASLSSPSEARAFFVFGDSLVDNGNNNFLATTARADSPPYGIDTPSQQPTGRFSNGLNIPDILS